MFYKRLTASMCFLNRPVSKSRKQICSLQTFSTLHVKHTNYALKRNFLIILFTTLIALAYTIFYFYEVYVRDPFCFDKYLCPKQLALYTNYDKEYGIYDYGTEVKVSSNLIKVCQNKVPYENELAVWSMISDDHLKYAVGAAKLLKSLDIHSGAFTSNGKRKFDALIMMLAEKPLESRVRVYLESVGWRICQVSRIAPRDEANTYGRFRDQFTKLNLWLATEYTANYYLDADTLIVSSLVSNTSASNFFNLHKRLGHLKIGATRDFRGHSWQMTFNMGVFVLKPNRSEFARLIRLKNDPQFKFETTMSEQGFLNVVYEKQWFDIGFENNANLVVYKRANEYWRDRSNAIRVIHFTMVKPWACDWVWGGDGCRWWWWREYKEPCNVWRDFDHCIY
jgi:hypothetical protein